MSDAVTADEFDLFFEQESAKGTEAEPEVAAEPVVDPEVAAVEPEPEVVAEPEAAVPVVEPVVEPEPVKPVEKVVAPAPVVEPVVEPEPEPEPLKVIDYTDEEKAAIAEAAKEFPEVTAALAAQERVMAERFEQILGQRMADMQKSLEPVFQTSQTVARNSYEAEILSKHADAFEKMDELTEWIGKQPALMQKAYNHVLDNSVPASEVIELYDIFKEATKAPEVAIVEEPDPEVAAATQRKLDAQEGVRSRRTDTKKDTGPLDFESAFNQVN